MSVREAQEKISSSEFAEWMEYYRLQPFGERRADEHNAWLCYWTYTTMLGNDRNPEDFMLKNDERVQSVDDKMNILQLIANQAQAHKERKDGIKHS